MPRTRSVVAMAKMPSLNMTRRSSPGVFVTLCTGCFSKVSMSQLKLKEECHLIQPHHSLLLYLLKSIIKNLACLQENMDIGSDLLNSLATSSTVDITTLLVANLIDTRE